MVQGPDNVTVMLEIPREVDPEVYDMYGPNGRRINRMLKEAGLQEGPRVQVYWSFAHMFNQPNMHLINRRQVQIMSTGQNLMAHAVLSLFDAVLPLLFIRKMTSRILLLINNA